MGDAFAFGIAVLMSASGAFASDSLMDSIRARIESESGAIVAVSYRDLETGQSLDIAADTVFHAASTMKVPVMIEVLKRAQAGAFSLDQEILLVNQFASLADGGGIRVMPFFEPAEAREWLARFAPSGLNR